ncbi:hypothetical protein P1P68_27500 [Streptomyces scabiei]|uniref:hypothetical protein n=1 Tax=Streptomyces scabiei TaxID=1930 RepID=UPI0029907DCB|nr:hypothetical protein [Streptomyces scabiei]MDW8808434.1 hypothetical protein [Streptomyces scabiei]
MTPEDRSPAGNSWIKKQFTSDVPPGRRALAMTLGNLCRHLKPDFSGQSGNKRLNQSEAAGRLRSNPSSLSRFLSGKTVPGPEFIETLYKEACTDAGSERAVGVSLDDVMSLRLRAVDERRCVRCADLSEQAEQLASLRNESATLRAAVTELNAAKAGLQARLAALARPAPPPVPRRKRDRRRSRNDGAAARRVAAQAEELGRGDRQDVALAMLRQTTTEVLSPVETAVVLLTLRQRHQNRLADNLIHVYGRDQGDRDVMQAALELHEQGAHSDAGALLRAAMR